jgi:tRNA pseudouridine38-40 synthase
VRGKNLKAIVAYDGTDFSGWQIQPSLRTVQGVLEDKISNLLKEEISLFAAGRTDKGVHAIGQIINFKTFSTIPPKNLQLALNKTLPEDIFIKEVTEVPSDFHARYSALRRSYRYNLGLWGLSRSPFLSRYCWYPDRSLDIGVMENVLIFLKGKKDFRGLAKRIEPGENTFCNVSEVFWKKFPQGCFLSVTANRFLPQMIRRIMALLIDIGTKKCSPAVLEDILAGKEESWPQPWVAPPQGLILQRVRY